MWLLVVTVCAAVLTAALLPAAIAWLVAKRGAVPSGSRRFFALSCTLLAYGIGTLVGALLLPLDFLATFVAPQLQQDGHKAFANAIGFASNYGAPGLGLVAWLSASVWVPLRLQYSWAAIAAAIHANNSSKPTPLRGAA